MKRLPTRRELEVLAYLSRGLTRQMTADAMSLASGTVDQHAWEARMKLRAKNDTHACCEALRRGLIT